MVLAIKLRGEEVDVDQLFDESECHDVESVKEFIDGAKTSDSKSRAIQRVFDKQSDTEGNPFDELVLADFTLELEAIEEMDCEA